MFLNITGLTERGKEIKSSNNKKLGKVHGILKNSIIMETDGGKRERFFLPSDMISKIHKKNVYLDLSDSEFREWWRKEAPALAAEYPDKVETNSRINEEDLELIRKHISIAFEENFNNKQVTVEVEGNTCPYCRSQIHISDRIVCQECGLSYISRNDQYTLTDRSKAALHNRQWSLRLILPYTVNEMIQPDEWISYGLFLVEGKEIWRKGWTPQSKKGVLVVSSQRVIHFIKGGGYKSNWEIPIDDIENIRLYSYAEGSKMTGYEPYGAIELGYRVGDGVKNVPIRMSMKEYRGEIHFLHKYLHILNEQIVDRPPPWTKSWFDISDASYTSSSCPQCNEEISSIALLCPICQFGTDFGDARFQETDVIEPPVKRTLCPHCNTQIRIVGPFCPRCGESMEKAFSEFLSTLAKTETNELETLEPLWVDKLICAYCGQENLVHAEFCTSCGQKLE